MDAPRLVGRSPAMQAVHETIDRVAGWDTPVLVVGEPGTGKRLVAQVLHARSARQAGPFAAVDCASLPPVLLASELFGHEKGAFPSAYQRRRGRIELTAGGTLLLETADALPADLQRKVLRMLVDRAFERLGSSETLRAECRIVATSAGGLGASEGQEGFDPDLRRHLTATTIHLPPLRERGGDLLLLVGHFLDKHRFAPDRPAATISPDAVTALERYAWPGNVRELEDTIERAVILVGGGLIAPAHLGLADDGP